MLVVERYFTDTGQEIAYQKMEPAFIGNDLRSLQRINDLSVVTAGIIPVFINFRQFRHPCPGSDVTPRFAILSLQDGQRLKLPYPFRPDTPDWYQFWQDLTTNPLIISTQGVGEVLSNSFLKRL